MIDWVANAWDQFATLANAINLIAIAISSAFAAFAGALGAQRIISLQTDRDKAEKNRNIQNSAAFTCYSILNAGLLFKKQHIIDLVDNYRVAAVAAHAAKDKAIRGAVDIKMDLRTLPLPRFPVGQAERILFHEMSLTGRAASAAGMLLQSIELLSESVRLRNDWITELRQGTLTNDQRIEIYVALETEDGSDERYANLIEAMDDYTDDILFFSAVLEFDIIRNLPKRKSIWRRIPENRGSNIKWRDGVSGLFPDPADYVEWTAGYPDEPLPPVLMKK